MSKSKIFFYSCLFFILGIGLASYLKSLLLIGTILLAIGCVTFVITWPNKKFLLVFLGGIFLFLGILRYEIALEEFTSDRISFYNEEEVTFIGIVSKEPDERKDKIKLTIKAEELEINNEIEKVSGNVLVNSKLYPKYKYGDRLEIKCKLEKPGVIKSDDGLDFAYDKYLAKENIYSLCYSPEIEFLESGEGNFLISALLKGKEKFVATVNKILPEPQAAFLGGLLYGARRSIPEDLMNQFNITGTTHIIAISGYNITILAAMLLNIAKGIGVSRKRSFWIALFGILFFVIIAGGQASIIRAAIMGGLVLLANQVGRVSRIKNALVFAAALMLIVNPKVLAFDAGFQLSFAATIGLIFLSPIFEKYFEKWPSVFGVKESLTSTMSAIILTAPLILYTFGRVSLVAPIANILILPVIPLAMAFGFVAVILGLINLGAGQIFGWLVWLVLSYIIKVAEFLSKISWASLDIGRINWSVLVLFYLAIGFFIYYSTKVRNITKNTKDL